MTLFDIALLSTAAFFAGAVNAMAGGGSFLTFPALVFTGHDRLYRFSGGSDFFQEELSLTVWRSNY